MSGLELVLRNLAAWSLQVVLLALAAAALSRLVPIDRPATRLALGQSLLALVVVLPLLQPWQAVGATVGWSLAPSTPAPVGAVSAAGVPVSAGVALWPPTVAAVLLLVIALRLAWLGAGLRRLRSLRRGGRPLDPPPWLRAARDELAPRAAFLLCDEVGSPATFGLRRPVVLLPSAFGSLPRERQEAMGLHELLHARRRDWLFVLLEELLRAALFFHPAVHWLVGQVRLAREQTVDAAVVRRLGARDAYLDSLVAAARLAARARAVPAAPFLRESHLRARVDLLLKGVSMSRLRTLAHVALTAAVLVLAASWAASALPLQATKPAAPAAAVPVAEPAKASAKPEPKLVHKVNPVYPDDAKAERVQGIFLVNVIIGKDGAIKEAKVAASAPTSEGLSEIKEAKGKAKWTAADVRGDARLAQAALDAVKQWRYEPILMNGKPAEFEATVTINFKLQ
jgi:beta-lactamase regulating signal transducer with metallopeptidase domain